MSFEFCVIPRPLKAIRAEERELKTHNSKLNSLEVSATIE
jgi:hypothetical protein